MNNKPTNKPIVTIGTKTGRRTRGQRAEAECNRLGVPTNKGAQDVTA